MTIDKRGLLLWLFVVMLCLAELHSVFYYAAFHIDGKYFLLYTIFNMGLDVSIPSLLSVAEWIASLLLIFMVIAAHRKRGEAHKYWSALFVVFVFLTLDEFVSLHEKLVPPMRKAYEAGGSLYLPWVVPYGIAAAVLALCFSGFLISLKPRTRYLLVLS